MPPIQPKKRGSNRQPATRRNPPQDCSPQEWAYRASSAKYRRQIKRAVQALKTLRVTIMRDYRPIGRTQIDALHWLADPYTFDTSRRTRGEGQQDTNATPTDSVKY